MEWERNSNGYHWLIQLEWCVCVWRGGEREREVERVESQEVAVVDLRPHRWRTIAIRVNCLIVCSLPDRNELEKCR